jgi:hypothetical protein
MSDLFSPLGLCLLVWKGEEIIHKLIPLLSLQLPVVHDASVVASA